MINEEILRKIVNNEYVNPAYRYNLFNNLKIDFKNYINTLYDTNIDNFKMYRKVLLNKSEFSKIIFNDNIINLLSLYYNQDFSTLNYMIKFFMSNYNINYFNPDILDDRLKNVYRTYQNKIYKNNTFDINKYLLFDSLMKKKYINTDDFYLVGFNSESSDILKMQEVYSEYLLYKKRYKEIENKELDYNILDNLHSRKNGQFYYNRWLAKYDGDGYGADLLFTIPNLGIEELHEIKKRLLKKDGSYDYDSSLSINEKNVIDETVNYKNTDYYIDLVDMQYCDNKIYYYSIEKYKLNKNTLQFVNEKKNKTLTLQKHLDKYIIICNN